MNQRLTATMDFWRSTSEACFKCVESQRRRAHGTQLRIAEVPSDGLLLGTRSPSRFHPDLILRLKPLPTKGAKDHCLIHPADALVGLDVTNRQVKDSRFAFPEERIGRYGHGVLQVVTARAKLGGRFVKEWGLHLSYCASGKSSIPSRTGRKARQNNRSYINIKVFPELFYKSRVSAIWRDSWLTPKPSMWIFK